MSQITTKWITDGAITPAKLDSSGSFTMKDLQITRDATVGGDLLVTGDATIGGNILVNDITFDDATMNSLTVLGDSALNGNLDVTGSEINFVSGGNIQIDADGILATLTGSTELQSDTTCRINASQDIYLNTTEITTTATQIRALGGGDVDFTANGGLTVGLGGNFQLNTTGGILATLTGSTELQSDTTFMVDAWENIYLDTPEITTTATQITGLGDLNLTSNGNISIESTGDTTLSGYDIR
ncbi:MAG: hypothetical protein IMZ64_00805, partial [Bacteroidetes bacterium]|nr:hypothetical protein [Bacteroidota bacterium]